MEETHTVKLRGSAQFRSRLVLSILSGRPVRISGIREKSERPGVNAVEVSFLRLLDKLTNGTRISINETGTTVNFRPGMVVGGRLEHDCAKGRAVGYYIEGVLPLCAFSKGGMELTLRGVTDNDVDVSLDALMASTLPVMGRFGPELGAWKLRIVKRGAAPGGGGQVVLTTAPVRDGLTPVRMVDRGLVKRIRGVAYAVNLTPQVANRMVDAARGVLNPLCADVYISTDHRRGSAAAGAPGFGLSLVAETTTECKLTAHRAAVRETDGTEPSAFEANDPEADPVGDAEALGELTDYNRERGVEPLMRAEDVGTNAAKQLVEEVMRGGAVDTNVQALTLLLMVLCPEDVSKVVFGPLTGHSMAVVRLIKTFVGTEFRIVQDDSDGTVTMSCLGVGYKNLARKVT